MYQVNWNKFTLLLSRLERESTGANIHNIRQKFASAKDRVEMWIKQMNKLEKHEYTELWHKEAKEILKGFNENIEDYYLQ